MSNKTATVVIPAYNQYASLKKVLLSFSKQSIESSCYEIIVVDDGSTDDLEFESSETLTTKYNIKIVLFHQKNQGRAAARNTGIRYAQNQIIIFCDADRIPCETYIEVHLNMHNEVEKNVVIGEQFDIFYKNMDLLCFDTIDWTVISRFSKEPNYFGRIKKIYQENKCIAPNLRWMSFMVGNASVSKEYLEDVGLFDEDFREWGFEHFELGYRLQKQSGEFVYAANAINYHIPHQREQNFYRDKIDKSALILYRKHPEIDISIMKKLLMNNMNVLEYNNLILKDDEK